MDDNRKPISITTPAIAILVILGFFGVVAYMIAFGVPETGEQSLLIMLGALSAKFGDVVAYYFGSSSGSSKKTDAMVRSIDNSAAKSDT